MGYQAIKGEEMLKKIMTSGILFLCWLMAASASAQQMEL